MVSTWRLLANLALKSKFGLTHFSTDGTTTMKFIFYIFPDETYFLLEKAVAERLIFENHIAFAVDLGADLNLSSNLPKRLVAFLTTLSSRYARIFLG